MQNPLNPFSILPMGVALGQIIGMARGELGLFFILSMVYSFGTFAMMMVCYQGMKMLGWTLQADAESSLVDEDAEWAYFEPEDEYGYDDESAEPAA